MIFFFFFFFFTEPRKGPGGAISYNFFFFFFFFHVPSGASNLYFSHSNFFFYVPSGASYFFFFLTSRKLFHMKFAIFDVARCRMSATSLTYLLSVVMNQSTLVDLYIHDHIRDLEKNHWGVNHKRVSSSRRCEALRGLYLWERPLGKMYKCLLSERCTRGQNIVLLGGKVWGRIYWSGPVYRWELIMTIFHWRS